MIRRLSLSQRLTLAFTAILLLCAVTACGVQLYSSSQYGNAMVQRLSGSLAQQIVSSESLLDAQGRVNQLSLKTLFDRLMTLNPSVELYLVSPDGQLLADAAPPDHLKRQRVAITPLQRFLSGASLPVYGDDPRSPNKQKVFSAAPINQNGERRAYLYIILQGEELNALADSAWQKTLWRTVLWSLLMVAGLGLLAGLLVWRWITCPVKELTAEVRGLERDSISTIKQLAQQIPENLPTSEVALLRNTFIELARKIVSQWDQLSDSDRQRREFIANISHDLRTPLTSLLGYLETLSMKAETLSPEDNRQYLAIALRQGHKVRHLSQQLFELAKLEHGGIKPQLERFSIGELIQDVAQKFDLAIATRQLQLKVDMPPSLPQIYADVSMIERVVTNLLDNAIRHTPQGGTIQLKVWQEHHQLQVEVADSGPGIEPVLREQLFQRPSALNQQSVRENRGGLGLLIVRRMLELHGGEIRLIDAAVGACFRFFVPI
ncbi:sensor histidine kinase [Dickeya zeae]|uniref:sensor histidine kinase n=1 Tax=Dickeya zeae TaxID=204042 RepID=UPI0020976720|nr:ATP-binding protein [Dickeya zeae]MCO7261500.1 sensor histidine kinase [Dickeya zeae]